MGTVFFTPSIKILSCRRLVEQWPYALTHLGLFFGLEPQLDPVGPLHEVGRHTVKAEGRARPVRSDYNSIITNERGLDEECDAMG